jgi:dTDP-glucose pyrophosphorylase
MKALILAAGRGTRLGDLGEPLNKCLRTFEGKHLLQYSLESAVLGKVEEIIIVVGYQAESIINRFGIWYENIRITYVLQRELKGLVDAIERARDSLDGDDFILFLADEIVCDPHPYEMIRVFKDEDLFGVCGVAQVEDMDEIKKTYSVMYDPFDKRIYRLIEKRHEKELPDLIQCAIDDGNTVKLYSIGSRYVNVNTAEDVEIAENILEESIEKWLEMVTM